METVASFLLAALVFGLSSGISPGPTLTLTISETLRHGPRAGVKVAAAPLITDGPIITFSWLVLAGMGESRVVVGVIAVLGAAVLFFFARECLLVKPVEVVLEPVRERALRKGVLTNMLNPAPYLFWVTVGTPTLLQAYTKGILMAAGFLALFFVVLVASKSTVALITARFRGFMRGGVYLGVMRAMGVALAFFGFLFLRKAAGYLGFL